MAIVIFEVGVVAGAYTKKDQLNEIVDKGLNKTLKGYKTNEGFRKTWHLMQTEVKKLSMNSSTIEIYSPKI